MDDACALGWGEDMTQAMVVGAKAAGHHLCWMWKAELQETNVAGKKLEWAKLGERSLSLERDTYLDIYLVVIFYST